MPAATWIVSKLLAPQLAAMRGICCERCIPTCFAKRRHKNKGGRWFAEKPKKHQDGIRRKLIITRLRFFVHLGAGFGLWFASQNAPSNGHCRNDMAKGAATRKLNHWAWSNAPWAKMAAEFANVSNVKFSNVKNLMKSRKTNPPSLTKEYILPTRRQKTKLFLCFCQHVWNLFSLFLGRILNPYLIEIAHPLHFPIKRHLLNASFRDSILSKLPYFSWNQLSSTQLGHCIPYTAPLRYPDPSLITSSCYPLQLFPLVLHCSGFVYLRGWAATCLRLLWAWKHGKRNCTPSSTKKKSVLAAEQVIGRILDGGEGRGGGD